MDNFKTSADVLFILLGAIMILAMHAGFAFLELGTVRKKNQVNALVKILCDFSVSTLAYFFIGYGIAYGVQFLRRRRNAGAEERLRADQVLFPADLRRRDPGHRFRRHRRARALRPATGRHLPAGRLRLPVLRGHRLEPGLRHPGLAQGQLRRGVPRFRRLGGGARRRRLDRPRGRAAARRAARTLQQGRRHLRRIRRRAFPSSRSAPGS